MPNSNSMDIRQWVYFWRERGFNVIPLDGTKRPALQSWKEYQDRWVSDKEIEEWLSKGLFQGIGAVLGKISGNTRVLDFDSLEKFQSAFPQSHRQILDKTLVIQTGRRGYHVYVTADEEDLPPELQRNIIHFSGWDYLGYGSQVVLPPTRHPETGKEYKIANNVGAIIKPPKEFWVHLATLTDRKDVGKLPVKELLQGKIKKGQRDSQALRITSYLVNTQKLDSRVAWELLQDINQRIFEPPIDETKLREEFEGWVKRYAKQDIEEEENPITEEALRIAEKILNSPDLLMYVRSLMDETGIVRENRNKLYAFLVGLTGKMPIPSMKQILVLKGEPGGGKTKLANFLSKVITPTKKVARFSDRGLDYSDLERFALLYLQELLGLEKDEKMGMSSIRFLSGDDEGYTIAVTEKDEEGHFRTVERKIPAKTIITTTTVLGLEKQFERRTHMLNMDESPETTLQVLKRKAWEEKHRALVYMYKAKPSIAIDILRAIVSLLEPCSDIIVTSPESIIGIFDTKVLRVRGDYDKVLALTKMSAWLHQRQRPKIGSNGKTVTFTLPQDVYYALEVGREPILTMATGLEKRLRDGLVALKQLVDHHIISKTKAGDKTYTEEVIGFRVEDFADAIGISVNQARSYLKQYEDQRIINTFSLGGRGNPNGYKVRDISDLEKKITTYSLYQSEQVIFSELEKESEAFFSSFVTDLQIDKEQFKIKLQKWIDEEEQLEFSENIPESQPILKEPLKHYKQNIDAEGP